MGHKLKTAASVQLIDVHTKERDLGRSYNSPHEKRNYKQIQVKKHIIHIYAYVK
jgi:hypothetical protein